MLHEQIGIGDADPMTEDEYDVLCRDKGFDPNAVRALSGVESGGRHFDPHGRLIMRFEPHKFPRHHWPEIGFDPNSKVLYARAIAKGHVEPGGRMPTWVASLMVTTRDRKAMFAKACALDLEAAAMASSWGAYQIMGFNHEICGYPNALAMVEDFAAEAANQLQGFFSYIERRGFGPALAAKDWKRLAPFNGSGQPDVYAAKMEREYRRISGHASPLILRLGSSGAAVQRLQEVLEIQADGVFGPSTDEAVRRFQGNASLIVDGVVGDRTWAALKAGKGARPPKKEDTLDRVSAEVEKVGGLVSKVSALSVAGGTAIKELGGVAIPETTLTAGIICIGIAGVLVAGAFAYRWARS